tara:strand:- start:424 stop:1245 length:822 start_codon:yes stop_codon:yes gene_type:complete
MPTLVRTLRSTARLLSLSVLTLCVAITLLPGVVYAQGRPTERITARIESGWRPASRTFAGTTTFEAFSELGSFEVDYEIREGVVIDGGLSFLLWRNLAVGLDVSSYASINSAQLNTQLPHPFFFDLPRTSSGVAGGLRREELSVHLRALWMTAFSDWLVVSFSGGPSLINARQDLVSSVQHREIGFPFGEIIFEKHSQTTQSENALGINAGIDIDVYALHHLPFFSGFETMRHLGLGVLFRYVSGSADLQVGDSPVSVDLGGFQVTTGIRFRF